MARSATGDPGSTADNTHEVAQRAAPDAMIAYVDNDPVVPAHADALPAGAPEGRTGARPERRPDLRGPAGPATVVGAYCGVGRKP
ncbi:hypothetical protein STRTUCAR8_03752 [Streptomyces turgidiscabies Car8]|uniref:Uncharacterized protein n=1 Tax=Streptomyces turgidiscabies (strain Car8) TaxID=698760 RepID=L7FF90_STRT8|nr:hypothetical protein STRTUCAR8_03752 [Streptomyces turgidiscabies Car8]